MRPWITVAASTAVAFAAAGALVRPELTLIPRSALLPSLVPVLPTFAAAALAVYGLCAVWLSAGGVIAEIVSLRRRLDRVCVDLAASPSGWEAVPGGLLRRLVPPEPAEAAAAVVRRFAPGEARREIAHLFYLAAARGQFFSALIVLVAIVVLGAAQQYGALPIVPGPIPTAAAALAVAGLVLLALLARIAVDVSAEPLTDAIGRLPAEPTAAELVGRAVERIEALAPVGPRDALPPSALLQILDRLLAAVEQSQQALCAASDRLAATTDRFAAAATTSAEALAETLRAGEPPLQQLSPDGAAEGIAAMAELRDAVSRLTTVLEHVRGAPAVPAAADNATASAPPRREPQPDLAEELRKLLQEIEAAP